MNEFIKRAEEIAKPLYETFIEMRRQYSRKWQKNNPDKFKESRKKYESTEKGKYTSSKRNSTRNRKFNAACEQLDYHERKLIGIFYLNCPEGYEVDHIIPVSKGGKHCLNNLQYLTKEENRKKSNRYVEIFVKKLHPWAIKKMATEKGIAIKLKRI